MKSLLDQFWNWYERNLTLNLAVAAPLFSFQLIHLYWLGTNVVALKLLGKSYFELSGIFYYLILFVDYTEIPALITTSLVYINHLRSGYDFKSTLFLVFIASQVFHIFWITDEFVVDAFANTGPIVAVPPILAWFAISIDYLEIPVIFDTFGKFLKRIKSK